MTATQRGFTVWFTGLPCSGKTTLATSLVRALAARGIFPRLLDGDTLRRSISPDLGFSKADREMHNRRVILLALSLTAGGAPAIVSLVSPYRSMRAFARERLAPFTEIYLRCALDVCEARDVKGMYRRARKGEIAHFTGVSDVYEEPEAPELVLDTDRMEPAECLEKIIKSLPVL